MIKSDKKKMVQNDKTIDQKKMKETMKKGIKNE